ncbi:MAG TPA: ATP-binding protein, partial [Nevskiaceae bacterium]|nr:ATP-binding protein [Nevskiaceae bacterium]
LRSARGALLALLPPGAALGGEPQVEAGAPLQRGGWSVLASMPQRLLVAPAYRATRERAAAYLAGAAVLALLIVSMYRWMRGYVDTLAAVASAVERGDWNTRVPVNGPRELRGATAALNEMLDARGRMERELAASLARQQALSRRLVELHEADQQRLSRELHDRIGQNLTALAVNLKIISQALAPPLAPGIAARMEDSRMLLFTTAAAVRNLITELRPSALDDYGLLSGLRWYGGLTQARSGMLTVVEGEELAPRLAPQVERTLFRIAQEALTNSVKHAQARHAWVRLYDACGQVVMTVTDDGIGLDRARLLQGGAHDHWGLMMMQERAASVAARLRIDGVPGHGTRVQVEVARDA